MTSPDIKTPASGRPPRAVTRKARARPAARIRSGRDKSEATPRKLDSFSVARLCAALQTHRADHFPVELDDAGFAMLIDLFLFDWFDRRAGTPHAPGIRIEHIHPMPGIAPLLDTGLAVVSRSGSASGGMTVTLSQAGRSCLDHYFEDMAGYIAAI